MSNRGGRRGGRLTHGVHPVKDANQLFYMGCNLMKVENYVDALDRLAQCLEIRVKYYGDLAVECAPAYYQYGRALYFKLLQDSELACANDGGPELDQGVGDDEDNHELEVYSEESSSDSMDEAPCESGDEAREASDTDCNREQHYGEERDCVGDEDIEMEIQEEAEADLELAWKLLDIARMIYERQKFDYGLRRVEVLTALGDVAVERGDYYNAWNDYSTAICILGGNVESSSRYVAELCHKICVALQCWNKLAAAVNYNRHAISTLGSCLQRLTNELKIRDGKRAFEGNYTTSSEVAKMSREEILADMGIVTQRLIDFKEKDVELLQMASEQNETLPTKPWLSHLPRPSPRSTPGSKRSSIEIDLGVFGRRKRIAIGVIRRGRVVRL